LGMRSVLHLAFVNTHIPERAENWEKAVVPAVPDPEAIPDPDLERPLRLLSEPEAIQVIAEVPDGPPASTVWRRITYRFVKASGPERIGEEWWHADFDLSTRILRPRRPEEQDKRKSNEPVEEIIRHPVSSRDYYIGEDETGRRFWLFHAGPH